MKQREIQDRNNTIWTCSQAWSETNGDSPNAATRAAVNNGKVPVVCTPSGGAKTIRLELPEDWIDAMSDQDLADAIVGVQDKS